MRIVRGHQKAITSVAYLAASKTLWTGSYEGRSRAWDVATGAADSIDGEMHSNQVSGKYSRTRLLKAISLYIRNVSNTMLTSQVSPHLHKTAEYTA